MIQDELMKPLITNIIGILTICTKDVLGKLNCFSLECKLIILRKKTYCVPEIHLKVTFQFLFASILEGFDNMFHSLDVF